MNTKTGPATRINFMQHTGKGICFSHGPYENADRSFGCPKWPACITDPQNPEYRKLGIKQVAEQEGPAMQVSNIPTDIKSETNRPFEQEGQTAEQWLDAHVPLQFLGSDSEPVGETHIDKPSLASLMTEYAASQVSELQEGQTAEQAIMSRDEFAKLMVDFVAPYKAQVSGLQEELKRAQQVGGALGLKLDTANEELKRLRAASEAASSNIFIHGGRYVGPKD